MKTELKDKILNTKTDDGMSLSEHYHNRPFDLFEEGWNDCYERLLYVLERINEHKRCTEND